MRELLGQRLVLEDFTLQDATFGTCRHPAARQRKLSISRRRRIWQHLGPTLEHVLWDTFSGNCNWRQLLSSSDPHPPPPWHFSDIVSGRPPGHKHGIYIYKIYVIYIYIFWRHSIWHSFWHILWHSIRHLFWHSMWHLFWHTVWHSFWHCIWHLPWHPFWHLFWHLFMHSFWHLSWHFIWHLFRHFIWHSAWHLFWNCIRHLFWLWRSIWHLSWRSSWHSIWHSMCHWDLELMLRSWRRRRRGCIKSIKI